MTDETSGTGAAGHPNDAPAGVPPRQPDDTGAPGPIHDPGQSPPPGAPQAPPPAGEWSRAGDWTPPRPWTPPAGGWPPPPPGAWPPGGYPGPAYAAAASPGTAPPAGGPSPSGAGHADPSPGWPYGGAPSEGWRYQEPASGGHNQGGPYQGGPYPGDPNRPPPGWSWPGAAPPPPRRPPRSPEERRRRRRLGLLLTGVVVVALGAGIGIGAALAPANPAVVAANLVQQAQKAAASAGSFHYDEVSTTAGQGERIVGDAGSSGGRQTITEQSASGTERFDLRLVQGVVYFRGNTAAVVDQLGVPTSGAGAVVGHWVKVTKGEKPYKTFEQGITAKSNISQLHSVMVARTSGPVSGSTPPATQVRGGVSAGSGHSVGTATLVLESANSRPEHFDAHAVGATGQTAVFHWTFGHYGEHVSVAAPKGAMAYSSLGLTSSKTGG